MILNLWFGFDDRAQSTAKTPDEDGNLHPSTQFLGDFTTLTLFRNDNPPGPRVYELWNMYFDDIADDEEAARTRNSILAMFPGQVRTIGGWWNDGREVGTEFVFGQVEQFGNDPQFDQPDILNPDFQPDDELPDFDPRITIPDPDWVAPDPWPQISFGFAEEIIGVSGDPVFPRHTRILEFIPDVDDIGTRPTIPSDVNLGMGQTVRRFS